jgi:chromosome segregation ATPase
VDAGFRGIQDAIATKFQDLEQKLQLQEQEITELRFSLNDANVTADLLDADKRQLKQRNEDLERKLSQSNSTTNNLRDDIRKGIEELRAAVEKQKQLKQEAEKAKEKAAQDHKALLDARKAMDEIRTQLDETGRELREAAVLSIEKAGQAKERGTLLHSIGVPFVEKQDC